MQIIKDDLTKLDNTVVTLGKFDGNHIGHRALFDEAKRIKISSDEPLCTVIFTFDTNPKSVVSGKDTETLYTNAERMSIESSHGMDYCLIWPFTKQNMATEPEEFVKNVLVQRLGVRHIVVGEDFRFGKERRGDVSLLLELGKEYGFEVHALEKITFKEEAVSSTRIKSEIAKGNLEDANFMLGAPFMVTGKVVPGKHLGKSLGFPTINFDVPKGKSLPPDGVYATVTAIGGIKYMSMSNIGTRPTFEDGKNRNIETNIFDFDEDLYGKTVNVEFYKFIRPERYFENAGDLIKEIQKNKEQIKTYFKG